MGIIDVLNGSAEKVASHLKNATDFDLTYVFDVNDEMPERIEIVVMMALLILILSMLEKDNYQT